MKTLIQNGHIVTAVDDYHADILIEDQVIVAIGNHLTGAADTVIDAGGRLVIPGGIDVHTHFDMPFGGTVSSDDFWTGTRAAAYGGTTTIVDFAMQSPGKPLTHAFDRWLEKAEGKAAIDYGFHMIMREVTPSTLSEMRSLIDQGVTSFKLFTAYPGVFMVDDGALFRVFQESAENGGLIAIHAENGGVIDVLVQQALAKKHVEPKYHAVTRPPLAEAEATHRAIALAEMAGSSVYFVHLSASQALDEVQRARDRGLLVYAETCPQYLFLSQDQYDEPNFGGAKYVMSPPLREREHQNRLWTGLQTNDLQVVSTDHCPFCMKEQKTLGADDFSQIPNGAPGVETRMSLIFEGGVHERRMDIQRFVQITATAPAKLFGMFPKKGTIAVGSDADIVIYDPDAVWTASAQLLHMRVDYNPFEGRRIRGKVKMVLSRGEVIVDDDTFLGKQGRGQFIKRGLYTPLR